MSKLKPHLKSLYRTRIEDKETRVHSLRLDMNENVRGLPEGFVKTVLAGVTPGFLSTYPEYRSLQEKIARHNGIKSENICISNGSDAAIKYIFDAYVNPKDKILFADPTFAMYQVYCRIFNAEPVKVQYRPDLSFPADEFLNKISKNIKLAIVVNPNSPTGSVVGEDLLIRIIEKARRNNVLVVVDEAYFYYYPKSVIRKVRHYKNLIVLRTFSKLCGMASARIGYAAARREIVDDLKRVKPTFDVNALGVLLAEKLLNHTSIIRKMVSDFSRGKQYLIRKLQEGSIEYIEGGANFVLIKYSGSVNRLIEKLSKKKILISGGFEHDLLRRYVRVTIGDEASMKTFWREFMKIEDGI